MCSAEALTYGYPRLVYSKSHAILNLYHFFQICGAWNNSFEHGTRAGGGSLTTGAILSNNITKEKEEEKSYLTSVTVGRLLIL